jgi:hypothetical protein
MGKYSKFTDIEAVLDKATNILPQIEVEYLKCLKEEKIPDSLLVDIKDYLGNLRSALDYIWYKIPGVSDGYFPVANSLADFSAKTIKIDPQYSTILQKYQDYNPNGWIRCFNLFRNKNTHVTLIPQKRIETQRIVSTHAGGGSVSWDPGRVKFGSGVSINGASVNPFTQMPISTPETTIRKEIWIDFVFDGSLISSDFPEGISALPFIKKSLSSVLDIITELEKVL